MEKEVVNSGMVEEFIEVIKRSKELAEKEAEIEVGVVQKKLSSGLMEENQLYKYIIKWKSNYLMSLNSEYYLIAKISKSFKYPSFKFSDDEKLAHAAFDYFIKFKKNNYYTKDRFTEDFEKEIVTSLKYASLYDRCKGFIHGMNNEVSFSLKLPLIDNFEIEIFEVLDKKNEELKLKLKNNCLLDEKFHEDFRDMHKKETEKLYNEIADYRKKQRDFEFIKDKLRANESYIGVVKKFASQMENAPIAQFNELYWGDNYPALKVLFEFFQKHKMIQIPWSLFADSMCLKNTRMINLNSSIFTKNDIGFLMDSLKPFFKKEFRNVKSVYNDWLASKFFIDNHEIKPVFTKKFVRNYNKNKQDLKNEDLINKLCQDIKDRHIE